jgi:hypothetical protein
MARIESSCNFRASLVTDQGRSARAGAAPHGAAPALLASVLVAPACARTQHGAELQEEVGVQDKNSLASALVALSLHWLLTR